MKRLISISLLLAISLVVSTPSKTEGYEAKSGIVITLDKKGFLTKVYNYEKNAGTWKYEGNKPCIVDFYADWCGPCRNIAPILAELAAEYKDEIIVYKVNVDRDKEAARAFGVRAIPALLYIPANGTPQMSQGVASKEVIARHIKTILLGQ